VDQYFGTTELPALLKALGADYKHELLGERLTTTQKNYAYLKLPKVATDLVVLCYSNHARKHVSQTIEKLVKEAEGLETV
jgi:ribosomal protein S12 methylthiotransferase